MGYTLINNKWVFTPKRGQRKQEDLEVGEEEEEEESFGLPASESEEEEQANEEEEAQPPSLPMPQASPFNIEEAFARLNTDKTTQFTNLRSDMEQGFRNVHDEMEEMNAYMRRFGAPPS